MRERDVNQDKRKARIWLEARQKHMQWNQDSEEQGRIHTTRGLLRPLTIGHRLKVSAQKCVILTVYGWLVRPQLVDPRVNMEADVTVLDTQRLVVHPSYHGSAVGLGQCPHWAQAKPLEFVWFNWNSLMWNCIWELWVTVSLKTDDIYIIYIMMYILIHT